MQNNPYDVADLLLKRQLSMDQVETKDFENDDVNAETNNIFIPGNLK